MAKSYYSLFTNSIAFVFIITFGSLAGPPPSDKTTVALYKLEAYGIDSSSVNLISDCIRMEMVNTGTYTVLERQQMGEVLKEQAFDQSGACDQSCVVQVGQLLGVRQMIAGSLGKIGNSYILSLRLVDVATGKIEQTCKEEIPGMLENVYRYGVKNAVNRLIAPGRNRSDTDTNIVWYKYAGKWGLKNRSNGAIILAPQFRKVKEFSEGFAAVLDADKWGYINKQGEIMIRPQYSAVNSFSGGLAAVKIGDKFGYIDAFGTIIAQPIFTEVTNEFSENRASVKIDGKWGYINRLGVLVISPRFWKPSTFKNGKAFVETTNPYYRIVIDTAGNVLSKR